MNHTASGTNICDVPETQPPAQKRSKKLLISIIAIAILTAASVICAIAILSNKPDPEEDNLSTSQSDTEQETPSTPGYKVAEWTNQKYTPDSGANFIEGDYDKLSYKKIANLDNSAEVVLLEATMPMTVHHHYFLVENNVVKFLPSLSPSGTTDEIKLASFVVTESEIHISELAIPKNLTQDGQTYSIYFDRPSSAPSGSEYEHSKILSRPQGDLYEITVSASANQGATIKPRLVQSRSFQLVTPYGLAYVYKLDSAGITNDDGTAKVTWNDSFSSSTVFSNPIRGCGIGTSGYDAIIASDLDTNDAQQVGTVTAGSKPVYKFVSGKLADSLYEYYSTNHGDSAIPRTEYNQALSHIAFQDGLSRWVILVNNSYGALAECGKPVVYLYPEQDTLVSVRVDANVRISDPLYSSISGWQNVLAHPSGQLTYKGKLYDYLFWEGQGFGAYPLTGSRGTIVTQKNLVPTIKKQLKAQGLNAKEISDFVDFWQDHLPTTPYVRLTWLTKQEIDTLAPLSITPSPQTVIRVFLDAEGLNKPVKVKSQTLKAPERKGFTVVEWGGLLY